MSHVAPGTTDHPLEGHAVPRDDVLEALLTWTPHQRWFPAKGTTRTLDRVAVIDLPGENDEAQVTVHLLRLSGAGLLQVPVVLRPDDGTPRSGVIASLERGPEGSPMTLVIDGCHDPAFMSAWLAAAEYDSPVLADLTGMRVLTGEQSNTSVLLPSTSPPGILKIFRGLNAGPNPDVDVPLALSHVGWSGVPRPLGWLAGSWPSPDGAQVGHLGVLSELVVGARDGFELACEYAREQREFGHLAEDLGRTTARMHRALREALPTLSEAVEGVYRPDAGGHAKTLRTVVRTLRARAAAAITATPLLSRRSEAIERLIGAVEGVDRMPPLQRVHGDFHLGQVLRSEVRGWAVLDFEGEPHAPAHERTRPDLALRDVAGMLRSFDYAAAVGGAHSPGWATRARDGLVRGYQAEAELGSTGLDQSSADVLLRALELDKALYEVVYESRNRPAWLQIPLEAVDRLLSRRA